MELGKCDDGSDVITVAKSPCTEECDIADHKLLTGGGLFVMANITPDMSLYTGQFVIAVKIA
jgi:hypothetical protein